MTNCFVRFYVYYLCDFSSPHFLQGCEPGTSLPWTRMRSSLFVGSAGSGQPVLAFGNWCCNWLVHRFHGTLWKTLVFEEHCVLTCFDEVVCDCGTVRLLIR